MPTHLIQDLSKEVLTPHCHQQCIKDQVEAGAGDVWCTGRHINTHLVEEGVKTALDMTRLAPAMARRRSNVIFERTVREL